MLIRLGLVMVLTFTTSCTASTPSTSSGQLNTFEPPQWVYSPPLRGLPAGTPILTGLNQQEAGWDHGLLLATSSLDEFQVFTSKNGHDWRVSSPHGVIKLGGGQGRLAAGYGAAAYLLGWSTQGPTVWRTEDGQQWETIPLDLGDLEIQSRLDIELTITAGPRGVLVVGSDNFHPPRYDGVYVWQSPDGRSFNSMNRIPEFADDMPPLAITAATQSGFLLGMSGDRTMLLSSDDGMHWQDITAGLPQISGIAYASGNASTVAVFTYPQPDDPPETPLAWYRHDGIWRPATMDPGQLPDAGVVPADERRVNLVRNWGSGFIAIGNTSGNEGEEKSGLVWYSADGSTWTRMPIRNNGFDTALSLMDIAVSKEKAFLIGHPSEGSEKLLMWEADFPLLK